MASGVFKALAVAGALIVPVAVATLFAARGADAQSQSSVGNPELMAELQRLRAQLTALESSVDGLKPTKFYLTDGAVDGAAALTACRPGFHMASLWEIHDVSNLAYDLEFGLTTDDSGFGPPDDQGWIRTGTSFSETRNCSAWTSAASDQSGTTVNLQQANDWEDPAASPNIVPWQAENETCNTPRRVWCVQG